MKKVTAQLQNSTIILTLSDEEYANWEKMSTEEREDKLFEEGEINLGFDQNSGLSVEEIADNISDDNCESNCKNCNYFSDYIREMDATELSELYIYHQVNKCETFEELAEVIKSITDSSGSIQGRTQLLDGEYMYKACLNYLDMPANCLTRQYGIRQQAMYIKYHKIAESMEEDLQKQADEAMEKFRESIKWLLDNAQQASEDNSEEDGSEDK